MLRPKYNPNEIQSDSSNHRLMIAIFPEPVHTALNHKIGGSLDELLFLRLLSQPTCFLHSITRFTINVMDETNPIIHRSNVT